MSEDISERMLEKMSEIISKKDVQKYIRKECQEKYQNKLSEDISEKDVKKYIRKGCQKICPKKYHKEYLYWTPGA